MLTVGDDTYGQEASYVADQIQSLLDGKHMIRGKEGLRPIEAEDIAILLRSPGSVGRFYQDALSVRGIRSAFGGGRDLLQTGEIGVLRALLQVLSNPRQDIPLIAVLCSPVFGFTADDLARIRARQKHGDFYDAVLLDDSPKTLQFVEILEKLRSCARQMPLARLLEEVFCVTRMDSIYAAMDSGVERTGNLREFYRLALDFESAARRDLSQFLEHLELLEDKGLTIQEPPTGGAVQILSIHKSKGLSTRWCSCPAFPGASTRRTSEPRSSATESWDWACPPWTGRTGSAIPPSPSGPSWPGPPARVSARSCGSSMWP